MHDLKSALNECKKELDALNIPYGPVVSITPNTTAASRWGQCRRLYNGTYTINISTRLLRENVPINGLKSTIMHELLHTCPNSFNHGKTWKRYAEQVNSKYGYNVQRCDTSNDKGVVEIISDVKFAYKCLGCGAIVVRNRASNFTKHPENYRCSACRGKFERIK